MKFLSLILLLVTSTVFAAGAQVNSVSQGGFQQSAAVPALIQPLSDLSRRITLIAGTQNAGTGTDFFKLAAMSTGGGQYQVAGTGSLHCMAVSYSTNTTTNFLLFGYGDTAVTDNDPTAPTTPIYFGPDSTADKGFVAVTSGISTYISTPIFMSFAANKFPFVKVSGSATNQFHITLDCVQD